MSLVIMHGQVDVCDECKVLTCEGFEWMPPACQPQPLEGQACLEQAQCHASALASPSHAPAPYTEGYICGANHTLLNIKNASCSCVALLLGNGTRS